MTVEGSVHSLRVGIWGALVAAAAVGGCGPSSLGNPGYDAGRDTGQPDIVFDSAPTDAGPPKPDASPDPEPIDRPSRYLASNRNVDLLFLVDDSSSMRLSQDNLRRNFPVLMQALKNQPGGLPNVHIGVISSDMGAGDGSVAGCDTTGGKNGIFQYTARGTCTSTGLLPGATYISDVGA